MVEESGFVTPDYVSVDIDYNTAHVWRRLMRFLAAPVLHRIQRPLPAEPGFRGPIRPGQGLDRHHPFRRQPEGAGADRRRTGLLSRRLRYFRRECLFVRQDLCREDLFIGPYTAEQHYEPPRYSAVAMRGHARHLPFADA